MAESRNKPYKHDEMNDIPVMIYKMIFISILLIK